MTEADRTAWLMQELALAKLLRSARETELGDLPFYALRRRWRTGKALQDARRRETALEAQVREARGA